MERSIFLAIGLQMKSNTELLTRIQISNIGGPILQNSPNNYSYLAKAGSHIFDLNFPTFDEPGVAVLAYNHLFDYEMAGHKETEGIIK